MRTVGRLPLLLAWCLLDAAATGLPAPAKFADKALKDIKADAKRETAVAATAGAATAGGAIGDDPNCDAGKMCSAKVRKLTRTAEDLREMLRIMRSWDTTKKEIPAESWWPQNISRKLDLSRTVKPEWRKEAMDDLQKKLDKVTRRAALPKTADPDLKTKSAKKSKRLRKS